MVGFYGGPQNVVRVDLDEIEVQQHENLELKLQDLFLGINVVAEVYQLGEVRGEDILKFACDEKGSDPQ